MGSSGTVTVYSRCDRNLRLPGCFRTQLRVFSFGAFCSARRRSAILRYAWGVRVQEDSNLRLSAEKAVGLSFYISNRSKAIHASIPGR